MLDRWGALIARNPWRVIVISLILAVMALPFAIRILQHLDANIFNQVSDDLPRFHTLRELSEDFAGDILVSVLSISDQDAADPERVNELKAFGDLLAAELVKVGSAEDVKALKASSEKEFPGPWLRQVECRMGHDLRDALAKLAREHPGAVLSTEDVAEFEKRFEPVELRERLLKFAKERHGLDPSSLEYRKLMADPLKLSEVAEGALKRRLQGRSVSSADKDGYYLSPDGTTLLVLARPVRSANEIQFDRALMDACQQAENRAIQAFRARTPAPRLTTSLKGRVFTDYLEGEPQEPALQVGYTGLHAISTENEASLRFDVISNTLTAGLFVLVIYLIVYRRARLAFYIILTLGLAVIFTLAITGPIHGPIGVLGAGFTAILIGMGEDYAVYLHNTFHSLKSEGESPENAMRKTMARCGRSILAAAATAAVAFFSITTTHFRGMAELGLLAGLGLTISGALMLSLFPALLMSAKGSKDSDVAQFVAKSVAVLARVQTSRKGLAAALLMGVGALLVCAGLLALGPDPAATVDEWRGIKDHVRKPENADNETLLGVRFDGDFGNLRSVRIQAIPLRQRMVTRFGQALTDIKVVCEGTDEGTAFAAAEETSRRLAGYVQRGDLRVSAGILEYVSPPRQQEQTLKALSAIDTAALRETFLATARSTFPHANVETVFSSFLDNLHSFSEDFRKAHVLTLDDMFQSPLGQIISLYARKDQQDDKARVRLAAFFFPARLDNTEAWYDEIAHAVETDPPPGAQVRMTSTRMVGFEMKHCIFRDMFWITMLVALAVTVLLMVTYRSPTRALLAALPLTFGYLFLLAGVQAAQFFDWNFALNYVNLMVFPLLLGTGIDYGIYMVSDACSERRPTVAQLVSETGLSVFVACLTTLAGFGSMIFSNYTGLVSFGWAALLGYSGALFGALVVLPSLISWLGIGVAPGEKSKDAGFRPSS